MARQAREETSQDRAGEGQPVTCSQRGWMVCLPWAPFADPLGPCHSGEYEFSYPGPNRSSRTRSRSTSWVGKRPRAARRVASLTAGARSAIPPDVRANSPRAKTMAADRRSVCGLRASCARRISSAQSGHGTRAVRAWTGSVLLGMSLRGTGARSLDSVHRLSTGKGACNESPKRIATVLLWPCWPSSWRACMEQSTAPLAHAPRRRQ